jgi:hypothetical protein
MIIVYLFTYLFLFLCTQSCYVWRYVICFFLSNLYFFFLPHCIGFAFYAAFRTVMSKSGKDVFLLLVSELGGRRYLQQLRIVFSLGFSEYFKRDSGSFVLFLFWGEVKIGTRNTWMGWICPRYTVCMLGIIKMKSLHIIVW